MKLLTKIMELLSSIFGGATAPETTRKKTKKAAKATKTNDDMIDKTKREFPEPELKETGNVTEKTGRFSDDELKTIIDLTKGKNLKTEVDWDALAADLNRSIKSLKQKARKLV